MRADLDVVIDLIRGPADGSPGDRYATVPARVVPEVVCLVVNGIAYPRTAYITMDGPIPTPPLLIEDTPGAWRLLFDYADRVSLTMEPAQWVVLFVESMNLTFPLYTYYRVHVAALPIDP